MSERRIQSSFLKIPVSLLPSGIRSALKSLRFNKREISLDTRGFYQMAHPGDDGARGFVLIGSLSQPSNVKQFLGDWGGGGLGVEKKPVDTDYTKRALTDDMVVVAGQHGSFNYATVYCTENCVTLLKEQKKSAGYRSYKGDPYWMKAKYPGVADDGTPFKRGQEVLYWPRTKTIMVGRKAEDAWKRFEAEAEDEDFMNQRYAGSFPIRNIADALIRLYNADAKRHGRPPRKHEAYNVKMSKIPPRIAESLWDRDYVEPDGMIVDGSYPLNVRLTPAGAKKAEAYLAEVAQLRENLMRVASFADVESIRDQADQFLAKISKD
jgi:hypothetical protein